MKGAALALGALLLLGGCDQVALIAGGEGDPIGAQMATPSGVVVEALSFKRGGERALVNIRVLNGRDRDIELANYNEGTYLLTDSGEKLMLAKSLTNEELSVPAGKAMDGALVFTGSLPSSGAVTLVLNANETSNSEYSSNPRIELALPLDKVGGGSVPETSALSNMRSVPTSRFGPAAGGGSTFGAAGNASSSLSAVAKLK